MLLINIPSSRKTALPETTDQKTEADLYVERMTEAGAMA